MAALSDYAESGLLNHIFRGSTFSKPSHIAIALTSGVIRDSDTGGTIPEIPSGINGSGTGYGRVSLGTPASSGDSLWGQTAANIAAGSGMISNSGNIIFQTALVDWGWVSGIAIVDDYRLGSGNLLMHATLDNPRIIYMGDGVSFDIDTLQIGFK